MFELAIKGGQANWWASAPAFLATGLAAVSFACTYAWSVITRRQDLVFQRSKLALERMLDLSNDPLAKNAQLMIDWQKHGHLFEVLVLGGASGDGEPPLVKKRAEIVRGETVLMALCYRRIYKQAAPSNVPVPDANTIRFIRDCFDRLFQHYSRIQRLIANKVIDGKETRYPTMFYLNWICADDLWRVIIEHFLLVNQYDDAIDLLLSMEEFAPATEQRFLRYERWVSGCVLACPEESWRSPDTKKNLQQIRRMSGADRSDYCYKRLDAYLSASGYSSDKIDPSL